MIELTIIHGRHSRKTSRIGVWLVSLATFVSIISLLLPTIVAAQPTGYQEYYVLGYEEHIYRAFLAIYEGPDRDISSQICSTVSLVATADHQVIYFDHWEDGYEADLLNPVQASTEIYGDLDPSNGGGGSDILIAGDAVNLTSDRGITGPTRIHGCVPVNPSRDSAYIRYDGGDRIISSGGPVDLTHAMWPLGHSWVGGAWEVYSRQAYAEAFSYRLPIGEDLYDFGGGDTGTYGDFRNVYLQLAAFEDNTTVLIDNGTDVINLTLDRGWTYSSMGYINSRSAPAITINSGTVIRSNKPTEVGLVTGSDSRGGDGFQGRFIIVLSDQLWGADYVIPVPSAGPDDQAELYLANPNDFPITVNAYDAVTQSTFIISPSNHISATVPYSTKRGGLGYVPKDSAVRFTSSDGVFGVVVAADTSDIEYDWGFAGIPAKFLTKDYYASWAPGTTDLSDNGSPIWVTPLADDTTFYVDFSPLDGVVDETFTLDVLQQRRIFDPDNDNTGTHIWATSEFAMAWGEDPRRAGPSSPYLDLGVTTLPLLQRWLDPVLTLDKTANPTILPSSGGTVTFTLVAQGFNSPLTNVDVTDTLPINWSYVPNSTRVIYPDGSSDSPDPVRNGQTLFWDLSADLDVNQSLTLAFQAQITDTAGVDKTAYDGFESGFYSGGVNWVDDWQEQGDDGNPDSGQIRLVTSAAPFAGSYHLQIQGAGNAIERTIDLDEFVLPTLRFVRRLDGLDSNDFFYLDVHDGTRWSNALAWSDGDLTDDYMHEVFDLAPYANTATMIRFRSGPDVGSGARFFVDQIEIYDGVGVSLNRGQAVGKDEFSNTLFSPTDDATVYISPFSLAKSVSDAQAEIGDTLEYTLSYVNHSASITATNVTVWDAVPIQFVTFQAASGDYVYDAVSGSIVWTLGTLSPGESGVVTFTVRVNSFVEDGTVLKNIGYIKSDQTRAGSNEVRTVVNAPNIEFSKAGPNVSARGQVVTFTLSYRNVGGSAATGVVISDNILPLATYVPGSLAIDTGSGWNLLSDAVDADQGAYVSPTLVIHPGVNAGIIDPGESGQIIFNVRARQDLPPASLILNSFTLDRDLSIPRESNTVVTRISDLLLEKAAQQDVVAPSDIITYSLVYENVSNALPQTDVYVLEPIPSFTSFIPGTAFGGDGVEYSWDNGTTWSASLPITPVTHLRWYDATLAGNARKEIGFAVRLNASLPPNTTISNMARATSNEIDMYFGEWIPSNEVMVGTVDLWLDKHVSQSSAWAGYPISYTIFYGNHGSADAYGVRIEDMVPAGAAYREGSIWGYGADDVANPLLVWDVSTVAAGAGAEAVGFTVVLDSDLLPNAVITNTATLSSVYGQVTSDPVTTVITGPLSPQLELNKQVSSDVVAPGEQFTYTLNILNSGRGVRGLTVRDVVPADTSFVRCGGAACELRGDTVVWGPLDLAGGTLNLTLVVAADDGLPNGWPIVNADYDLLAQNAPPLVGLPVTTTINVPELTLVKFAFRDQVFAGSRLDYGMLVGNTGGQARHLVVSDTLPANTTYGGCDCTVVRADAEGLASQTSASCGLSFACELDGDTILWQVDEMDGNRSLQMTFWVTVDAGLSEGSLIVNDTYAVAAEGVLPLLGSTPVTTTVRQLRVSISKVAWPNPVTVSQTLFFTITVRNEGSLLRDLTVSDLLPSGASFGGCGGALCEFRADELPSVRWWLSSLPGNVERKLTLWVYPNDLAGSKLVNEFYSVWIPAASQQITGERVEVTVMNSSWYRFYLPLVLSPTR